ncbi:chromosomal replication initiator DnaA [Rhizobium sp. S-51]|uniref:Chromosomal replication initiator DnaA n=1 Tax=Rhizobium terricola TaxID=2728849 RepID=A0A7Y0FYD5_9HYPH|nr:helix-turn-helix domain-containing protein [Rhizobium terricola]NML76845.1 chromosomal replication initiator DnaA [Rhizobium terricola]
MPIEPTSALLAVCGSVSAADALVPAEPSPGLSERRLVCMVVRQLTAELLAVSGTGDKLRSDRRRATCHLRQISMYVCHVALSMPYGEVALAFGVDRTTVSHACHVVEDRRDDAGFDAFVCSIERMADAVCMLAGRTQ